ncbi:YicC/YloC family endoribonuclease, partial [Clostridioides difficile]
MAISMTGFGRGEYKDDNYYFLVECKTINHKYSDINIRLPRKISFLEDKVRNLVKNYVKRGRVDLYIKFDLLGKEDVNLNFDEGLASQYIDILKEIKNKFDIIDDIS